MAKKDAELNRLVRRMAKLNEEEATAAALGHRFGKLLQTKWPSNTSLWATTFASGLFAVEDDCGDRHGCRDLLIRWVMERFAGLIVEQAMPDLLDVYQRLLDLRYTRHDRLIFNDLDNRAWVENAESPSVFVLETQCRRYLVVIDEGILGSRIEVRRAWYKCDEKHRSRFHLLRTLASYRRQNWVMEYGDCRDEGYMLSYGPIISRNSIDGAHAVWHEIAAFLRELHYTQDAIHATESERLSHLHESRREN